MNESARPATIVRGSGSPTSTVRRRSLSFFGTFSHVFTSPTRANVNYELHAAGQVLNSAGEAVLQDNVWKVSEATFCTLVVLGNGSRPVKGCPS